MRAMHQPVKDISEITLLTKPDPIQYPTDDPQEDDIL
jgi:hypothetical protein